MNSSMEKRKYYCLIRLPACRNWTQGWEGGQKTWQMVQKSKSKQTAKRAMIFEGTLQCPPKETKPQKSNAAKPRERNWFIDWRNEGQNWYEAINHFMPKMCKFPHGHLSPDLDPKTPWTKRGGRNTDPPQHWPEERKRGKKMNNLSLA